MDIINIIPCVNCDSTFPCLIISNVYVHVFPSLGIQLSFWNHGNPARIRFCWQTKITRANWPPALTDSAVILLCSFEQSWEFPKKKITPANTQRIAVKSLKHIEHLHSQTLYKYTWATDEITCWGKCHHQMWMVPYRFCSFWIWIMGYRFWVVPYRLCFLSHGLWNSYSLHASIKYYVQGLLHHKKTNKYVYIIM